MKKRALSVVMVLAVLLGVVGCGGGGGSASQSTGTGESEGTPVKGGILRVGSMNYIDSMNPFNYIESQAYQAMLMVFPQLVQYATSDDGLVIEGDWADSWDTSADGKDWTTLTSRRGRHDWAPQSVPLSGLGDHPQVRFRIDKT